MYCPIDGKPCPDDLCHGGGCVESGFSEPMLDRCEDCGELVSEDELTDLGICEDCRDDFGDDFDDDEQE